MLETENVWFIIVGDISLGVYIVVAICGGICALSVNVFENWVAEKGFKLAVIEGEGCGGSMELFTV